MTARWTVLVPLLALIPLALTWGTDPSTPVVVVAGLFMAGSVLAAVHHAEVVTHRVGEPFGSLVLAVAVTVIEVALIVTLMMSGGDETSTLARDTVFGRRDVQRRGHRHGARDGLDARRALPRAPDLHDQRQGPLILGLGSKETVLLAITIAVGTLTVVPGRATTATGRRAPRAVRRVRVPGREPVALRPRAGT